MPGYSGTPLAGKLGYKPGMSVLVINAPAEFPSWIAQVPEGARLITRTRTPPVAVHLFVTRCRELERRLVDLRRRLAPDGFLWVSWPKRASKVATDITEDVIRQVALPIGFVDIKVCAVSEVWSGLKLVIRRTERGSGEREEGRRER